MRRSLQKGLNQLLFRSRLFSTSNCPPSSGRAHIEKIDQLTKAGKYDEAMQYIEELEQKNLAFALKTSHNLKGKVRLEKLRASGELDKIFTSPYLQDDSKKTP